MPQVGETEALLGGRVPPSGHLDLADVAVEGVAAGAEGHQQLAHGLQRGGSGQVHARHHGPPLRLGQQRPGRGEQVADAGAAQARDALHGLDHALHQHQQHALEHERARRLHLAGHPLRRTGRGALEVRQVLDDKIRGQPRALLEAGGAAVPGVGLLARPPEPALQHRQQHVVHAVQGEQRAWRSRINKLPFGLMSARLSGTSPLPQTHTNTRTRNLQQLVQLLEEGVQDVLLLLLRSGRGHGGHEPLQHQVPHAEHAAGPVDGGQVDDARVVEGAERRVGHGAQGGVERRRCVVHASARLPVHDLQVRVDGVQHQGGALAQAEK